MKNYILILALAFVMVACSPAKDKIVPHEDQLVDNSQESTEKILDEFLDKVDEISKDDYNVEVEPVKEPDLSIDMQKHYESFAKKIENGDEEGAFNIYLSLNKNERKEWNKKFRVKEDIVFEDIESILEAMQKAVIQSIKESQEKRQKEVEAQKQQREEMIRKMVEDAAK